MKFKILLLVLISAMLVLPVAAQSYPTMHIIVPFEFHVGDIVLPAGDYHLLHKSGSSDTLVLRGAAHTQSVMIFVPVTDAAGNFSNRLVFRRYGEKSFLTQICMGGSIRAVPVSKTERLYARDFAAERVVVLAAK